MQAPREKVAFVAMLNAQSDGRPDALGVVDVDPASKTYASIVGRVDMPNAGDELLVVESERKAREVAMHRQSQLAGLIHHIRVECLQRLPLPVHGAPAY